MEKKKEFTPRVISRDEKGINDVLGDWDSLTGMANLLLMDCALFLKNDDFSASDFLKLNLNAKPEDLIAELVTIKGDAPSGINPRKLVELGLIDGDFRELHENFSAFHSAREKATRFFKFPLEKAISSQGLFYVPDELIKLIERHFTELTKHQGENETLAILERFIETVNDLARVGLVRPQLGRLGLNPVVNIIATRPDRKGYQLLWNSFKLLRNRVKAEF